MVFSHLILPNGKPGQLNLVAHSDADLAPAAVTAVENLSFSPARDFDGGPVASRTTIMVTFRIFRCGLLQRPAFVVERLAHNRALPGSTPACSGRQPPRFSLETRCIRRDPPRAKLFQEIAGEVAERLKAAVC